MFSCVATVAQAPLPAPALPQAFPPRALVLGVRAQVLPLKARPQPQERPQVLPLKARPQPQERPQAFLPRAQPRAFPPQAH